MKPFPT